jgi:cytochrome P450
VALSGFGKNIVASEGENWKKFRKIVAPAFSEVRFATTSLPMKAERDCSEK